MKKITLILTLFIVFSIPTIVNATFEVWSVREGVFVIGQPSPFIIYVKNENIQRVDNYTITPNVGYTYQGDDLSYLIQVHLVSDKIQNLEVGKVRETQGAITLLGPVFDPPGATITFTVQSDGPDSDQDEIITISGALPNALPEFGLIGFLQLFLLVGLVVFYSSHIS